MTSFIASIQPFHFLRPYWLLALLPFIAIYFMRWTIQHREQSWLAQMPLHLKKALMIGEQHWRQHVPLILLGIAYLLLVIVLAGPSIQRHPSPFSEDKAPLVIVLDNSESMQQTDVQPTRLARAKYKIKNLIQLRGGSKNALVVYSGSAHIAMPFTRDNNVFTPLLAAIEPQVMPLKGKLAQRALSQIAQLSEQSDIAPTVLLVTDGLGSDTAQQYSDYFVKNPQPFMVYAIGDQNQPSAIATEFGALKQLAKTNNADYIELTLDNQDLATIVETLQSYQQINGDRELPWKDNGYPILLVVALLFLLWFRRGWTVQWSIILLTFSAYTPNSYAADFRMADLWMTPDQQGQYYFNQKNYAVAAERFESPIWKATAYYMNEDFEVAQQYFMRVDTPSAMLSAANALAHRTEYIAARGLYAQLLARWPNASYARHNLGRVNAIIEAINRQSESQTRTADYEDGSRELDEDTPQTGDGAEETISREQLVEETFSAEQLLGDPALNESWMRRIASDPARFLSSKFMYQLQSADSEQGAPQ